MRSLKGLVAILTLFTFSLYASPVSACTIFSASNENTVLVGNNEDWFHNNFTLRFYPSLGNYHGYAAFIDANDSNDVRAGMNDAGVFIDSAAVPWSNVTLDPEKPFLNDNWFKRVLRTCESVNDSLELFSRYNLANRWNWQFLIADSFGESVLVSAGPDDQVAFTRKNETFQLTANGNVAYPELGQSASSEWRYNTAFALLNQMSGNLSAEYFTMILDAVAQQGTAFSSVYDLINREIYVFFNRNYSFRVIFNLDYELELGYHSYHLPTYFQTYTLPPEPWTINGHSVPFVFLDLIVLALPILGCTLVLLGLGRKQS
jgi:hypothetical protein